MIYAAGLDNLLTFIIILSVAGVAAFIAFFIYRLLHPKMKKDDDKPEEETMVKEELNRVLEEVEDEETAKAISEYKDEDDK